MSPTGTPATSELVFLPLGGIGEIGLNVYLYGLGPVEDRHWLMIDCGITFPDATEPGVDVVLPDLRFIEEEEEASSASSSRTRMKTISEPWPRCGLVCAHRFTRRNSQQGC